jgi:hypothetical protein
MRGALSNQNRLFRGVVSPVINIEMCIGKDRWSEFCSFYGGTYKIW